MSIDVEISYVYFDVLSWRSLYVLAFSSLPMDVVDLHWVRCGLGFS